jgi:hypothetical protein
VRPATFPIRHIQDLLFDTTLDLGEVEDGDVGGLALKGPTIQSPA